MNLTVRCMARREGAVWVALCIDFSLAAQGESLSEARSRLHAQIGIYVREAFGVDAKHAEVLLSRRAPLFDRFIYRWCKLKSKLMPKLRDLVYREALPLTPAVA